jgi:hypothetical protein
MRCLLNGLQGQEGYPIGARFIDVGKVTTWFMHQKVAIRIAILHTPSEELETLSAHQQIHNAGLALWGNVIPVQPHTLNERGSRRHAEAEHENIFFAILMCLVDSFL